VFELVVSSGFSTSFEECRWRSFSFQLEFVFIVQKQYDLIVGLACRHQPLA
jgi:hypothetical protein